MSVDKRYCMSSYIAFRYIDRDDKDFFTGMRHKNYSLIPDAQKTVVSTAAAIGEAIDRQLAPVRGNKKIGVMLSGGMDSAIVASYVPGADAYTFRFLGGSFQKEELERAERYAAKCGLNLHYVDISWDIIERNVDAVMERKCSPVHSIEPQILQAALQAKEDGVEMMLIGDAADYIFGGMDKLLSKDWTFDAFVTRYCSLDPKSVLADPLDMTYAFEPYRLPDGKIDFLGFMNGLCSRESYSSYCNAFETAGLAYYDPYERLIPAAPLDLERIRNGEPKYMIRELMSMRYPDFSIPEKIPMPRPVDIYFSEWAGPVRPEFKRGLDMSKFTGNQKWQLWCLERFLNKYDKEK